MNILQDKPLPPVQHTEVQQIEDLRKRFGALSIIESPTGTPPSEAEWNNNMNLLREMVLTEDPRAFLRWKVIEDTMFVRHAPYLRPELKYMKEHSLWSSVWEPVLEESHVGHPVPFAFYPRSSGNLIHHAYHAARFQDETDLTCSDLDTIVEFGGGYGSLCRVYHKLGFSGKYIIFDLPHFTELQKFYLKASGFQIISPDQFSLENNGICCISDIETLKTLIEKLPNESRNQFTATWSLSETPLHIRQSILPLVNTFNAFLIAYQHRFNEMDNIGFFKLWRDTEVKGIHWMDAVIAQLPGSSYLFGCTE
jgi:hypothetical protein